MQQGKFFGHEYFLQAQNNINNCVDHGNHGNRGSIGNNGSGSGSGSGRVGSDEGGRERMGVRALVDCSMYLLSENNILHLVRTADQRPANDASTCGENVDRILLRKFAYHQRKTCTLEIIACSNGCVEVFIRWVLRKSCRVLCHAIVQPSPIRAGTKRVSEIGRR